MDFTKLIKDLKKDPAFAENVGMILVHNGIIRAWSRQDKAKVTSVKVITDNAKLQSICQEMEKEPGIYKVIGYGNSGLLRPGDDALFLLVAGDIRENVKRTLAALLDRVKKEAVRKEEHFTDQ